MLWKQLRRPPLDEKDVVATIRNLARLPKLEVRQSSDFPLSEEALIEVGA
jgi:hypothetical protein